MPTLLLCPGFCGTITFKGWVNWCDITVATSVRSLVSQKLLYKDWKLRELNYTCHCPVIRPVGEELWVAGKTITAQFPPSVEISHEPSPEKIASLARQDARLARTPRDWHTAIWRLVDDHLEQYSCSPQGAIVAIRG